MYTYTRFKTSKSAVTIATTLAILLTVIMVVSGNIQYLVTFEGGGQHTLIYPETGGLVPGTPIRFPLDSRWITLTSGPYANNPSGITIALWASGRSWAEITFDEPVGQVSLFYASFFPVTLSAYSASGTLLDEATAPANVQPDGFTQWAPLEVSAGGNVITRVVLNGRWGRTGIDDFCAVVIDIEEAIDNLIALVEDMNLHHGLENSLMASLEGAAAAIERGNDKAAVGELNAFINKVEAQKGKKIPEEEADCLIETATAVIASIE